MYNHNMKHNIYQSITIQWGTTYGIPTEGFSEGAGYISEEIEGWFCGALIFMPEFDDKTSNRWKTVRKQDRGRVLILEF